LGDCVLTGKNDADSLNLWTMEDMLQRVEIIRSVRYDGLSIAQKMTGSQLSLQHVAKAEN